MQRVKRALYATNLIVEKILFTSNYLQFESININSITFYG